MGERYHNGGKAITNNHHLLNSIVHTVNTVTHVIKFHGNHSALLICRQNSTSYPPGITY